MALGDKLPVVMGKEKAVANGVATLGADGILLEGQRPTYTAQQVGAVQAPATAGSENQALILGADGLPIWSALTPALTSSADLLLSNLSNYQKALRNIGGRPNRNLLDNWYFVGGGSQQGGGQFPINQRGQTSYQNGVNAIDRWICNNGATVTINSSGVVISRTSDGPHEIFIQRLPLSLLSQLAGQVVTLSAIINGQLGSSTFTMPEDLSTLIDSIEILIDGLNFDIYDAPSGGNCRARFFSASSTSQFTLTAAKLELGSTQTLAYQDEDGNWQLFETPDYGAELAKCQRYFQLYSAAGTRPAKAVDCRPVMRTDPVQSTAVIGETTYYCNNAEL